MILQFLGTGSAFVPIGENYHSNMILKAEVQAITISELELEPNAEGTLRKLLELLTVNDLEPVKAKYNHPVPEEPSELTNTLNKARDLVKAGKYGEALRDPKLEAAIALAFEKIADIPFLDAPPALVPLIEKGRIITTSAAERLTKSRALEEAFDSLNSKAVAKIFEDEYVAMHETLGLDELQIASMKEDIAVMATELVQLMERTKKGEMSISSEEQDAYFLAIQQIATKIDVDINDVRFKINSSATGRQTVTIIGPGHIKSVEIDLGEATLPYTLIKPVGGNFIFSYGGARGVIAPFAGMDESVKEKRFFSHSKLLGVGQYGSVQEVEHLLTGLNQVVKKGYVPADQPTFTASSRTDLRTRPITARDDPLYRVESDILQILSKVEKAQKGVLSGGNQYWIEQDKARQKGALFTKTSTPTQYEILSERAKGDTLADTANKKLNLYAKADPKYHDPTKRTAEPSETVGDLNEMLALSRAIITGAQDFASHKFSHNDIKPENFLYKRNPDGSYEIRYIDWATGGFEQPYTGAKTTAEAIFIEVFGDDLSPVVKDKTCAGLNGRFVTENANGSFTVGIKPTLEILHGARNGTLPYISPKVLGERRDKVPSADKDERLNTVIEDPKDPFMDDWALTAMTFGVCNRHAYFTLVKGRVVNDYVVPNVLESDGGTPAGLKITNVKNFNALFACGEPVRQEDVDSGAVYRKTDSVMFIPGNQREGEPLHLYRRLQMVRDTLQAKIERSQVDLKAEKKIVKDIDALLTDVRHVVASGEGYTKSQLMEKMAAAQQCMESYEKLNNVKHQQDQARRQTLEKVLLSAKDFVQSDELLVRDEAGLNYFEILCTYPDTPTQVEATIAILTRIMPEASLNNLVIERGAPNPLLFKSLIEHGQNKIAGHLLTKITQENPAFVDMVIKDGLLHYAAEKGMTDVFTSLVAAMKRAGALDNAIFAAMVSEYGPGERIKTAPHIKWATNCFHIAIRNNNAVQLKAVLDLLPPGKANDVLIDKALHLAASFGNTALFKQIVDRYNAVDSEKTHQIDAARILGIVYPPDGTSPYHLFIRQPETQGAINWEALEAEENAPLTKTFLLKAPENTDAYPMLLAARNGNYAGVERLIKLGVDVKLSKKEWDELFTQKDEYGKSVLNYVLEQGKLSYFPTLLAHINTKCSAKENVLVFLASNPYPNNPLQNFLRFEKNEKAQFKVVGDLLNSICSDFATAEKSHQNARIAALLVNEDWLIAKAQTATNHANLKSLLQNTALSIPYKAALFARLSKDTPLLDVVAKKFFDDLLLEVTPRLEVAPKEAVALDIPFPILQDVARQKADLNSLINALGLDSRELVERLERYEQDALIAERAMAESLQALQRANLLLKSTTESLTEAQLLGRRLTTEISELQSAQVSKVQDLERQIESLKVTGGEALALAKAELETAKDSHQEALLDLQQQVLRAESMVSQLRVALEEQTELLLKEKQVNQGLRSRVDILESENVLLRAQLESTILIGKREKVQFRDKLREEQVKAKELSEEVEQVRSALLKLGGARDELQLRVETLSSENDVLSKRVSTLEKEVEQYKQELVDVGERLVVEQRAVKNLQRQFEVTTQALVTAEDQRDKLRSKIDAQEVEHLKKVEALTGQIALVREEGGVALEKARLALEEERTAHGLRLQSLESTLGKATLLTKELQGRLESQGEVLVEKESVIARLREEVVELGGANKRLQTQVLETQNLSEVEKRELSDKLREEQVKAKELGEEVEQVRSALLKLGGARDELQLRVETLSSENDVLSKRVSTLEKDNLKLQQSLQEKDQALEQEKALGREKDLQIAQMQALLVQLFQQKAEEALLRIVEQSTDPELVHKVAKATTPQELLDIGLKNDEVNALIKFNDKIVWPKVVEAGKVRSAQLEEIAINALKGQIAGLEDSDLLRVIASANSNSDLQEIGLDDDYVAGLWRDTAFQPLKEQAHGELLAIEADAIDALLLEVGLADEETLKKIVIVNDNDGLKAAGLSTKNVDLLYSPDAHTHVVENAKFLLAAMLRKQQQALESPHEEPHIEPHVDHPGKEDVDLEREAREQEARERELALARKLELAQARKLELDQERERQDKERERLAQEREQLDRERERLAKERERDLEVDKENIPPKKKESDSRRKPKKIQPDPGTVDEIPTTPSRDGTSSSVVSSVQQDATTVPSRKVRMLLVEQEGILEFTEGRVAANKFKENLPVPPEQLHPGNELVAVKMNTAYYQGALIGRDEVVRASKDYTDPEDPTNKAVGLLVQDCTGKITDFSSGSLSQEQKSEIAFKQAQMMLANYRKGDGDLIVRGKNVEQANMVFAALLVLRNAHPDLKQIKIKCWVPGTTGPEYAWHTRDSVAESNFIKQYLPAQTLTAEAPVIKQQIDQLTTARQRRFKDMYQILKQPDKTQSEIEEELAKYSLRDGDKLSVSGKVTRVDPDSEQESDSPQRKR
jgi:serine/threonine protein kinase